MINKDKLNEVLVQYKNRFLSEGWEDEKYKWEAVKCFQDNWDVDADDFSGMLHRSLDKTFNLLASTNNFPRKMIESFSQQEPEEVRGMFIALFDESKEVFSRIKEFKERAEALRDKYNKGKQHFQNENAISTYLWLHFPDKYYIYKYSEVKAVSDVLESDHVFKKGDYAGNIRSFYAFYDEICAELKNDSELISMLEKSLTEECYKDPERKTLTIDVGFFISRYYSQNQEPEYWPSEDYYDPGLTKENWKDYIENVEMPFHKGSMKMLKGILELGGEATCKKLTETYGGHASKYVGATVNLGSRVKKYFNLSPCMDGDVERFFPNPFVGRDIKENGKLFYSYKLRDELKEALEELDLSAIDPKIEEEVENRPPVIWKMSHGTSGTGLSDKDKKAMEAKKIIRIHSGTQALGTNRISQGEDFIYNMKKGDYFYLCYGSEVVLLGRVSADDIIDIEDNGRSVGRPYEVVKMPIQNTPYKGVKKRWTPNFNSTCVKVDDEALFEDAILKPYFNMDLNDLGITKSSKRYWWLNANPRIWSFSDFSVGESQSYTLYNDNGNKRRVFQNFIDAKEGDAVIGYEASPVKKVVALARVSKEQDGQTIEFEKTEGLNTPIDYKDLKDCQELEEMEYFVNPQGSLFRLSEDEYNFILDMIREQNPISAGKKIEGYSKIEFLNDVFMSEDRYDTLVAVLDNKKNIILQGAPGVGKTFAAKKLAYSIMGEQNDDRIEFVQFHQNYSYEDFVMGYKPVENGFQLKEGIFYRFCQKAANNPGEKYFFIIDEINRGNMSKIFGELLMLIEKDYRNTKATLAYNGMPFYVPDNLYIIGMMNTADRSLAMIDYALRRRFSFFDMEPGFDTEGFVKYQESLNNETFNELIANIKDLNKAIASDKSLGKGFCIGHSYFCNWKTCTEELMRAVVDYEIIPMLSEYWFDDLSTLQKWENNLHSVFQ